ncbi:MAG: hypothetical protein AABX10_04250 [Nanoarchaeota archaeon]
MIKRVFASSIITLIILSTLASSAGSSSGNAQVNSNATANTASVITCENTLTLRERIKCRIENPSVAQREAYESVEEACRGHANATISACENLYRNSARCYNEENSIDRKKCFLEESGVNINAGGTFRATPTESKRNYVVLLLYELQERIEGYAEEGKITTDQASSLITKIVEIKRMIIAGESRANIEAKIIEFKKEYRVAVSSFIPGVANDS